METSCCGCIECLVPELSFQDGLRGTWSSSGHSGPGIANFVLFLFAAGGSSLRETGAEVEAAAEPGWKAPDSGTPCYHFREGGAEGLRGEGKRLCCVWRTWLVSGLNQAHGQRSRWKAQGCPSGFGQRLPALPL